MIAYGRTRSTLAIGTIVAAGALLAGCGGGGSSHAPTPAAAAATARKPDATITLTVVPSQVLHATKLLARHRAKGQAFKSKGAAAKATRSNTGRKPLFIDPNGDSISVAFSPYNPSGNSAPQTIAGPVPLATSGPTTLSATVYSGLGSAYGVEVGYDDDQDDQTPYASNQIFQPFIQVDPGTNSPISVTLSLVPAHIFVTTDQTIANIDEEANDSCFNAGNNNHTQLFALIPADAGYDYAQMLAGSMQTPPPSGLNGAVTLSNIMGSSDNGGSSTIVATGATWNGYNVYQFQYTPVGQGDQYAPPVSAIATTVNPDGGYDFVDNLYDPPGNNGSTFTENVTITPGNDCG